MVTHLGQHAVVIGGSLAGLMTARVLADRFDAVTMLERDHIDTRPALHQSIPHGNHLHVLLLGGQQVMASLYPGFIDTLERLGGVRIRVGRDVVYYMPDGKAYTRGGSVREPREKQLDVKQHAGIYAPGLKLRIVDVAGNETPHDGVAMGRLLVKGPWIASTSYKEDPTPDKFPDGWLDTGDVATLDAEGYMAIADRSKDLVKSGGEWISSVDLENAIMAISGVAEAALIAVNHPKWQERPLACVVVKQGATVTTAHIYDHLGKRFAKWWLPDEIVFIDAVPKTSVGKFDKKVLREQFKNIQLATASGDEERSSGVIL